VTRILQIFYQKTLTRLPEPLLHLPMTSVSRVVGCLFALLSCSRSIAAEAREPEFAPGSTIKLPQGGYNLAVADVNKDGNADLLVCGKNQLHALLGNGRAGFTPAKQVSLPHGAGETVTGDFNHDGLVDWAGAHHDYYEVLVMLGRGDGSFAAAPGSPFKTRDGQHPHTHGLVAADVNADGHLDLLTCNNSDNDVSVLLGDGKGAFSRATNSPFAVAKSPYPFDVGDVNGDGKPDIVTPSSGPGLRDLSVLLGDGKGNFQLSPKSPRLADVAPWFVVITDLNTDGVQDIATTHNEQEGVSVFFGDKAEAFRAAPGSPFKTQAAWGIVAADMNGDGSPDLAISGKSSVTLLLNDGRGAFRRSGKSPIPVGKGAWRLCVADFNNDRKLDIATGNVESDDVTMLVQR
jgi:hypothetical protein